MTPDPKLIRWLAEGNEPQVLVPFDVAEARTIGEAAQVAGRSIRTVRYWADAYFLGRKQAGQWRISIVALTMFLDGAQAALTAYLMGDRTSELVIGFFRRLGVPVASRRGG